MMMWDRKTVACVRELQSRGLTKDEVLVHLQQAGKETTWPAVRRALLRHKAEFQVAQTGPATEVMVAKARRRATRHFLGVKEAKHRVSEKSETSVTFRWLRTSGVMALITVAVSAAG